MQEEVGLRTATDGEFRRASWHMDFIYQLGGVRKVQDHLSVKFHSDEGDIEFTPSAAQVAERISLPEPIFADAFRVPRRDGVAGADAEADDPVAEHGPLPRRPGGDRRGRLPGPRPVLERPHRRLRRPGAGDRRARLHLPAVRRHEPRLPQRPRAARARALDRRRRRAPARDLHPPHQRGARAPARRHGDHHAHVQGQLPLVVGRRGRLRLRGGGAVRRARRRRLLHGVGRRALRRLRAAALRPEGQGRRARPRHDQARRARGQGPAQAPHRGGDAVRGPRPALPVAAVRLLLHRRGQQAHARTSRPPSCG